jgi:SAM-dependent methyltransferase
VVVQAAGDGGPFGSALVAEDYRRHLQPVIFEPWARRLVAFAGIAEGQTVLDVAAGTGAVSREAAAAVGRRGRVIASDLSGAMLSHVGEGADAAAGTIETLVCDATSLALPDGSVDVAVCQHGFQFMPDRVAVAAELRRVLRPGGVAAVAVWLAGVRMEPFDTYADAMRDLGIVSGFGPVPNDRLPMTEEGVAEALRGGGLVDVTASTATLDLEWPSVDQAARGIAGTPFGAVVHGLEPGLRERLFERLRESFDGRAQRQVAVLGRGVAPAGP